MGALGDTELRSKTWLNSRLPILAIGVGCVISALTGCGETEEEAAHRRAEEARCQKSAECVADKSFYMATSVCTRALEEAATYGHEWVDGTFEAKFSSYRINGSPSEDEIKSRHFGITYYGNKLKLQNGFGAFRRVEYACLYNPKEQTGIVLYAR